MAGSAWSGRCRTMRAAAVGRGGAVSGPRRNARRLPGRWRDEHRGKWFTVPKLSGFCLLMKRAVYDAIGGLDERFGLGFFDDDDLAERARRAGFELAVAHDLFVHHFGSRTFAATGSMPSKVLDENAASSRPSGGLPGPDGASACRYGRGPVAIAIPDARCKLHGDQRTSLEPELDAGLKCRPC